MWSNNFQIKMGMVLKMRYKTMYSGMNINYTELKFTVISFFSDRLFHELL